MPMTMTSMMTWKAMASRRSVPWSRCGWGRGGGGRGGRLIVIVMIMIMVIMVMLVVMVMMMKVIMKMVIYCSWSSPVQKRARKMLIGRASFYFQACLCLKHSLLA